LSMWDFDNARNARADVSAEKIVEEGFEAVFKTWGDTNTDGGFKKARPKETPRRRSRGPLPVHISPSSSKSENRTLSPCSIPIMLLDKYFI
ncbi:MAG: H-type lectin domain-containing protein, partial [Pseudomonadota bacterium]